MVVGNTYPARQRPIVATGRYDRFSVEAEKVKRETSSFSTKLKILYSPPSGPYDMKMYEGDLLFTVLEYVRFGAESLLNRGARQTPVVRSSLNGRCMDLVQFKRYENSGLSKQSAERTAIYDSIQFVGLSFTNMEYDGKGLEPIKAPVIQLAGANKTLNNGPDAMECGDYAVWYAPLDTEVQNQEEHGQGWSVTRRRLRIAKLQNVCDLTFESLVSFLDTNKVFKTLDHVPFQEALEVALNQDEIRSLEHMYLKHCYEAFVRSDSNLIKPHLFAPFEIAKGLYQLHDRRDLLREYACANLWLCAHREERDSTSARTFAKIMRGGTPGQIVDIVLLNS